MANINLGPSAASTPNLQPTPGRAVAITIAASDSLNQQNADLYCNGVNDDVIINNALWALRGTGGTVLLRAGTYYLGNSIVMDSDWTTLQGEAHGFWGKYNGRWPDTATEGLPGGAKLKMLASSTDVITVGTNYQQAGNRHQGLAFRRLYIYGNSASGIYDTVTTDISIIEDCTFQNCFNVIYLAWDTPKILNCSIQSCNGFGIQFAGVWGTIQGCIIYDIGGTPVIFSGSGGHKLIGCTIGSCCASFSGDAVDINAPFCVIQGNTIQGVNQGNIIEISDSGAYNNAIVGNTLSLNDVTGSAIPDTNTTGHGIYVHTSSTNNTIVGNTINDSFGSSTSGYAVALGSGTDATATYNTVVGNALTGGQWNGASASSALYDGSGGSTNQFSANSGPNTVTT